MAVWVAGQAAIQSGFGGVSVDMASALAVTTAMGVRGDIAASLLVEFQIGLQQGVAETREDQVQTGR